MKKRKVLSVIFYIFCIISLVAGIAVSVMSFKGVVTVRLGFLLFMPLWIISYWFSTFFYLTVRKKTQQGVSYAIERKKVKILNKISNALSFLLLVYWIFVYIRQVISYKHL